VTQSFTTAQSIDDALAAVASGARPVAGGTDLVVGARQGKAPLPDSIVAIHQLAELRGVEPSGDPLRIGALTTHEEIAEHPLVVDRLTALADAAAGLEALDHGLGRSRAQRPLHVEPERERFGVRQRLFQDGGDAIGRDDVEADPGAYDDARGLRLRVSRVRVDEDIDLAGDVEIMRPAGQAGVEDRSTRRRERAGAVQHKIKATQRGRR